MRIAIDTLGTRGDVQPYLAVALGLKARGHEVRLAAPAQFTAMAEGLGIGFLPLPGDFLDLIDTPEGKAAIAGGSGFSAGFKLLGQVRPLMRKVLDIQWEAARDFRPDLLVYHPKCFGARQIGLALDRPCVLASPLPGFTPTAAFASPLLPFNSLGPLNRLSHRLAMNGADLLFRKTLRQWRQETLGLSSRQKAGPPAGTLYAYSRHVLPVPRDWGPDVLVSGYWFLEEPGWRMPAELQRFLAAGPKPVYVGFGSMPGLDPVVVGRTIVAALQRTGKRGLLAVGGGAIGLEDVPDTVRLIPSAPHSELFKHVESTIHHGGAGTTGASLRAGLPTTICPFFGDQPFWARRLLKLGVAPPPLNRRALTVESVAAALEAMDDTAMRERAAELGRLIRREDGIAAAAAFLEQVAEPRNGSGEAVGHISETA